MNQNNLFVIIGNARTFLSCIDSCYKNIISKIFSEAETTVYIYFYLKLTDPGPKGQSGWNFNYKDVSYDDVIKKIDDIKSKFKVNIDYKILLTNEISDEELISQVGNRSKYVGIYSRDSVLLRGLHCHYNFEKCGEYIIQKEKSENITFSNIIYIRPDLYFTDTCYDISKYDNTYVILGCGPNPLNNDHIAIIPRKFLTDFFFERMNVYRNNNINSFQTPEEVYWFTIRYKVDKVGTYYIKRE